MYKGNTQVELRAPQRSRFDLSHEKKLSTRAGRLTPILCLEAIPGDVFRGSSEILLRVAPLLAPIYDSLTLYVHYFFVPNRLLWTEWEEFITGGRLGPGVENPEPIPPYWDLGTMLATPVLIGESTLADYLGVPELPGIVPPSNYDGRTIDAMPFLAYQKCYYDYYRDRNYIPDDEEDTPVASGVNVQFQNAELRTRDYMKNYFTAALPFTQRGTEVLMPLAGTGSVTYLPTSVIVESDTPATVANLTWQQTAATPGDALVASASHGGAGFENARLENIDEVTLTSSSVSINDLRSAVRLQEWLERNAVAGSRYTESIQAHFAVKSQDSRLQRSEFLGGGRIPIKISEIVTTAWSQDAGDAYVPAANMAGHGVTYGNTNKFRYYCPEHGFIIGIMSIMSKPSYYQGLPKMFRRRSFLDYPWPTFAKLGEQPVSDYEIFANASSLASGWDAAEGPFGYQSRYAEWKQAFTTNHGQFRSSLLFWTLAVSYSTIPTLSNEFTEYDGTIQDRIFAVPTGPDDEVLDNFWCYINNDISVKRCLPYFGTPTL